ncbi:MAG: hypothetical protein VW362_07290 [Candidatus Nanopelagicales bacterium]
MIRWRGDRDFTSDRDIRNYPLYHHELLDWQEGPTSLLWRLRFDVENRSFLDELRDAGTTVGRPTLLEESSEFINEVPVWFTGDSPPIRDGLGNPAYFRRWTARVRDLDAGAVDNVLQIGPVRDGILYATEAAFGYRHSLGAFNSWVFATGVPVSFGFNEDWQAIGAGGIVSTLYPLDPFVDVPLAIDVGCIRCSRSQNVATWPVQRPTVIIYDELFDDDGNRLTPSKDQMNATYGAWYHSSAPEEFDVTYNGEAITVPGVRHEHENHAHECQAVDDPMIHSHTWSGDISDANIAAACPPVAVCWTTGQPKVLAIAVPYACTVTIAGLPTADDNGLLAALGTSLSLVDTAAAWTFRPLDTHGSVIATPEGVIGNCVASRTLPVDIFWSNDPSQWAKAVSGGTPFERCHFAGSYAGFPQTSTTWVSGAYETLSNGSLVLVYGQYFLDGQKSGDADSSQFLPAYFWNALEQIL